MAPHFDAPSPAVSYSSFSERIPSNLRPLVSSSLRSGSAESQTSLSSSFDDSSLEDVYAMARPLVPGVYVPTVCFFDPETEDVDTKSIAQHAVRLAQAGVTGLATQGSNGEAVHLTRDERCLVTQTTRNALNDAGFRHIPIIVGCGAQSTREAIQLCRDASKSGGDYALVLPPAYYASLFAPSSKTILDFFTAVADSSPIPLIIYNFPGAVNGMDLSSDLIVKLSQHQNIVGVKLTCGNTGKLNRVAAATRKLTKNYDPKRPEFLVLAGSADFSIQSLAVGGHGILAGLANIAPKACLKTIELYGAGKYDDAQEMQDIVSQGDWVAIQSGVIGVKSGLQSWLGYGGYARSPLPKPTAEQANNWKEGFRELWSLEKAL
ncbi:dihydrodipicolinate synthase [Truncatella angustata]|uniref:Dihydrodipicolinate synthase n=1 Tax=Truncatella angustata TaxID=152316 RepID=A0A9P8UDV3_9PEZI|nr:dihydrodipicolinate synthase [Truncatella angustata]KAH6648104.1 dihydrodipicolinate synthase [Truncatella angustata]